MAHPPGHNHAISLVAVHLIMETQAVVNFPVLAVKGGFLAVKRLRVLLTTSMAVLIARYVEQIMMRPLHLKKGGAWIAR